MSGVQTVVGAAGIGLIAANEWTSGDRGVFRGVLWDKGANPAAAHKAVVRLGGELLFVLVAVIIAGLGGHWALAVGAAIAALWVLWLINRGSPKARTP